MKGEITKNGITVSVTKITDWDLSLDMARSTMNKDARHFMPSNRFKKKILLAEHSPIRTQQYLIEMKNIPCWVSQHLARHDAFASHTVRESSGEVHYVGTSRTDRTGINRNDLKQNAPVNHSIYLNAQDLINISKVRLCNCASPETKQLWKMVKDCVEDIDPVVASVMQPSCIHRGFCPETEMGCGFDNSASYYAALKKYRSLESCRNETEK